MNLFKSTILSLAIMSFSSVAFSAGELPEYFHVNLKQSKNVVLDKTVFNSKQEFVFKDKRCFYTGKMIEKGNIKISKETCHNKIKKVDYFAFEKHFNKNPRYFPAKSGTDYILVKKDAIRERKPSEMERKYERHER